MNCLSLKAYSTSWTSCTTIGQTISRTFGWIGPSSPLNSSASSCIAKRLVHIVSGSASVIQSQIHNLTHKTLETLQLETTDWEIPAIGPHTKALSLMSAAWYERVIPMLTAGLAAFSALTAFGIARTLVMHYKRKLT